MGYQILYLLLTIAVVTSKAPPQPYKEIISQILEASAKEEPAQNGTSCPSMFSLVGGKCLFFASFVQESHVACRQVCHSLGGELAAIRTATELEQLIREIETRGLAQTGFWIDGTYDEEKYWNFTNGELVPLGTPLWYATEGNDVSEGIASPTNDSNLKCTSINKDSGFLKRDVNCEEIFSPLCEHEPIALDQSEKDQEEETDLEAENISCPPFFIDISGNCIAFITWTNLPWTAAAQTCNSITSHGKLLVPRDIELLHTLYEYLHKEGLEGHSFWLGASDNAEEGIWIDGEDPVEIKAPFWGNSNKPDFTMEPDGDTAENCLALTSEGQHYFRDKPCTEEYNPLCTVEPLGLSKQ